MQLEDSSFCSVSSDLLPTITFILLAFRFLLSSLLLILALTRTWKESVDMLRATKQWQPNRYMTLLARHGIIYFFTYVNGFLHLSYPSPTIPFYHVIHFPYTNNQLTHFLAELGIYFTIPCNSLSAEIISYWQASCPIMQESSQFALLISHSPQSCRGSSSACGSCIAMTFEGAGRGLTLDSDCPPTPHPIKTRYLQLRL